MNLLGDNRYTTPGEYAAFADGQSAARRDRVYEANRATLEAAYRAQDPKLTAEPDPRRPGWPSIPLGWVEHKLAWSPSGELGKWATRNPAIVKIGGTLFVHGGLSAEYAEAAARRDQPARRRRDGGGRRQPDVDPHRPARARCGIAAWSRATPMPRRSAPRAEAAGSRA